MNDVKVMRLYFFFFLNKTKTTFLSDDIQSLTNYVFSTATS